MTIGEVLPASLRGLIREVEGRTGGWPGLAEMFAGCFSNTLATTVRRRQDGTTFVVTGDIPAMWLRDSAAQVRPYLVPASEDPGMAEMIAGVSHRQAAHILHDPYANAFNETANGNRWEWDPNEMSPLVFERKYEVDSLCYPIQLAYLLWKATERTSHLDDAFRRAVRRILEVWKLEQDHEGRSGYRYLGTPGEGLPQEGRGSPVAKTGMTWSGFRPSDDPCAYGYLVPSNAFVVVVLGYVQELSGEVLDDEELGREAEELAGKIEAGLREHAKVEHPGLGEVYAYETDGLGNHNLMDDANVPSLLSLPYLGYRAADDPAYLNTRRFVLSGENPYYYEGRAARGIGSPHTPPGYFWPIAVAMQGLTATDPEEREECLRILTTTDAGTGLMHEGVSVDDPGRYTRPWFGWANSLFAELVLYCVGIAVPGSPLEEAAEPLPRFAGRSA